MHHSTISATTSGDTSSASVAATRALGRALGAAAQPGTVLALTGPLGAGKTQIAKGVAEGLAITSVVNSPTFVLMNEHEGRLRLFHIDAYRLTDPEEALAAGLLDDRQATGVTVIEWADRLDGWLPEERLDLALSFVRSSPDHRRIAWRSHGASHAALAERLGRRR